MRVNTVNQGGTAGGGFDIAGATLTGPLILAADPVAALEATTKKYVDNAINSLNASHISTGTLPVGRLPAFTGDFSSVAGSNSLTLSNTTVIPGTYTKVTVDSKGRVTAGASLTAADIPALSWTKIVNNKPNTMDGFGITDGVKTGNDNVTGFLTAHAAPTAGTHAATKGYVDNLVIGSATLSVGDTVRRTSSSTPTGFLRCNGGEVNKTTYAALYAVVGDTYGSSIQPGSGRPWQQHYNINTTQSADFSSWPSGGTLPTALQTPAAFITKDRVYLVGGGGSNGANPTTTIYTAPINASGVIGAWTISPATIPVGLQYITGQAFVTKNRVYIFGGHDGTGSKFNTYTATINADGTISSFTLVSGGNLPGPVYGAGVFITKDRVYVAGGTFGTNMYTATIDANGIIGAWTTGPTFPANVIHVQCIVTKNRVFVLGGTISGTEQNTVYTASINADGTIGTWSASTPLPAVMSNHHAYATANRIWVWGGNDGTGNFPARGYTAPINADGTLGTWTASGGSSPTTGQGTVVATSTRVYTLGGVSGTGGTTVLNTQYYATIVGGLNDYTPYYDGTFVLVDGNNFKLPDTTQSDPLNIYTFIKF